MFKNFWMIFAVSLLNRNGGGMFEIMANWEIFDLGGCWKLTYQGNNMKTKTRYHHTPMSMDFKPQYRPGLIAQKVERWAVVFGAGGGRVNHRGGTRTQHVSLYVHTTPDSCCVDTKAKPERTAAHRQERWFQRDYCNGGKLRCVDLESGAFHIG